MALIPNTAQAARRAGGWTIRRVHHKSKFTRLFGNHKRLEKQGTTGERFQPGGRLERSGQGERHG